MESILSYPNRGQGGDSRYRGNCYPLYIYKDIFARADNEKWKVLNSNSHSF